MDVLNRETLIFLGIALLLINIIIGALLKRRFRAVSAIVATVACVMVITGIVQVTLTPAAAQPNAGNFRGFGGNGNAGGFGANGGTAGNPSFTGGNASGNTNAAPA